MNPLEFVTARQQIDQTFVKLFGETYYANHPNLVNYYEPHDIAKLRQALEDLKKLTKWEYKLNYFDCSNMSGLTQYALQASGFETLIVVGYDIARGVKEGHAWVVVILRSQSGVELVPVETTTEGGPAIPRKGVSSAFKVGNEVHYQTYDDYISQGYAIRDIYQAEQYCPGDFNWWNSCQIDRSWFGRGTVSPSPAPTPTPTPTPTPVLTPSPTPTPTVPVRATTSISRTNGAPGTSITITGSGFGANETGITVTWDGTSMAAGLQANTTGAWTVTFLVPPSASGSHTIAGYGTTTQATGVTFTVVAAISISQTSGAPGTSVTVTGVGFAANESGITVTFDGTPVASGIRANAQGSLTATFVILASPAGSHSIAAYGSITPVTLTIGFVVMPSVSISQTSGTPGTSVAMTGSGFGTNETGITITWDGSPIASNIRANSQGGWSSSFIIPASAAGAHTIHAYGSVTLAAATSDVIFTVVTPRPTQTLPFSVTSYGFSPNPTTLGNTVIVSISLSGGSARTYTLEFWKDISLFPDEFVTSVSISHDGNVTSRSFNFTPTSKGTYHLALTYGGNTVWSQPNDSSRLRVN